MAITLVSVEAREVLRCDYCGWFSSGPATPFAEDATGPSKWRSLCRWPATGGQPVRSASAEAGLQVAGQVREIRKARHLSQRQVAKRMQVPRTYISKIENGKAIPTVGSLERLAAALEVDVRHLVRDARSRRDEEVGSILGDPFLAEVAALLPYLDSTAPDAVFRRGAGCGLGPPPNRIRAKPQKHC
jgi:transcriptional regulator with XRE-family HTH domain